MVIQVIRDLLVYQDRLVLAVPLEERDLVANLDRMVCLELQGQLEILEQQDIQVRMASVVRLDPQVIQVTLVRVDHPDQPDLGDLEVIQEPLGLLESKVRQARRDSLVQSDHLGQQAQWEILDLLDNVDHL